jgi:hypothetical protein
MSLSRRFAAILRPDLLTAAVRFPVPVAAALLAMILIVLRSEDVISRKDELYGRVLYGCAAAFAAGVAGRIWLEARNRPAELLSVQLAAIAIGVGAAFAVNSLWLTPPMLLGCMALLVVAAPGLSAGGTPARFWSFNITSTFAALVGALGAGAFVLGLWAIFETLKTLFDLRLPYRLMGHVTTVGFVLVLPLYWLALQPKVLNLEADEPPPDVQLRALAVLTDFILIPLVVAYTVILHVYAAKIAVDAALPRGQIGWMISIFLALGYLSFLLAFPRHSPLPGLRRLFRLAWPPATLVPIGLLALALRERMQTYGVTEDRYLIGIVAAAAALLIVAWLPKWRLDVRLVPVIAAGLLLIAASGPTAARLMSVHSQAQRFVAVLEASGALRNGRFADERSALWGSENRRDVQSIIDLLESRRALHLIAPVVGADAAADASKLKGLIGLQRTWQPQPTVLSYVRIDSDILLGPFSLYTGVADPAVLFRHPDSPEYALRRDGSRLALSGPDGTFSFDLSAEPASELSAGPYPPRVVHADDNRAALVVRRLTWNASGETRTFAHLDAQILIRQAGR